jgi:hypothetical protein
MSLAGTYAATALLLAASLLVGRAALAALGKRERSWLAPAAGFAVLMIAARLANRLPGRATTAMLVLSVLVLASTLYLIFGRRPMTLGTAGDFLVPAAVAALVLGAVSIPFLANDRIGVLGVGRQSDLQAHIYAADFLTTHIGFRPDAIGNGYPLGPHAVVAAISRLTGATTSASFVGFVLAIPVLTAWTALAALEELPALRRVAAASLVGLPYLAASFLTEGTFKETAEGLYLLAFALALADLDRDAAGRRAMVAMLVALAGASIYTYSYPGLAWPVGAAVIWGGLELLRGRRLPRPTRRSTLLFGGIALLVVVAIAIPEAHRISDFRHTVSVVEETRGRLRESISPAQGLGLWPAGNFRIDPADPALATAMAGVALVGLLFGLLWWLRRGETAVPAALAAAVLVYAVARLRSGLYIEAKALAVLAPLPMLISLRALLTPPGRLRLLLGTAICIGASASTFMVLRAAPVGPSTHGEELARLRPLVAGNQVLFLGLDRLSQHELRGAYVRQGNLFAAKKGSDTKPWDEDRALDFDSLPPKRLNRFDFVVTTSAGFNSVPPINFRRVAATRDYVLWRRTGRTPPRQTLFEPYSIGGRLNCSKPDGKALSKQKGVAGVIPGPRVGARESWSPDRFVNAGESASQELNLPKGEWRLSLQYQSPLPVRVTAPGLRLVLPPTLDGKVPYFEGAGPFWPAGSVRSRGGRVRVTVQVGDLGRVQRLLGVKRRIALGVIAATSTKPEQSLLLNRSCGRFVDWYLLG